ncbi:AAA family ATPase [Streptomyces kanamyceticus]|uniref:AAA family ATPase n=2 Tax=Streptomyces kanamyceticus TaxID=1967 RepID=UPI00123E17F7|nr:AAA family ATPase [Streptomyces kanamyceticus]
MERPLTGRSLAERILVGRTEELGTLRRLLAQRRLVTVVGGAGVGKSLLAAHAAAAVGGSLPDGVVRVRWWDGGPARRRTVAQTVAEALDAAAEGTGAAVGVTDLVARLRSRRMLVVLDDFDPVRADCVHLVHALLEGAPGVRILAAGRHPLGLGDEAVLRLGPLAVTPSGSDDAELAPAVALFLDRVRAASAGRRAASTGAAEVPGDGDAGVLRLRGAVARARRGRAAWAIPGKRGRKGPAAGARGGDQTDGSSGAPVEHGAESPMRGGEQHAPELPEHGAGQTPTDGTSERLVEQSTGSPMRDGEQHAPELPEHGTGQTSADGTSDPPAHGTEPPTPGGQRDAPGARGREAGQTPTHGSSDAPLEHDTESLMRDGEQHAPELPRHRTGQTPTHGTSDPPAHGTEPPTPGGQRDAPGARGREAGQTPTHGSSDAPLEHDTESLMRDGEQHAPELPRHRTGQTPTHGTSDPPAHGTEPPTPGGQRDAPGARGREAGQTPTHGSSDAPPEHDTESPMRHGERLPVAGGADARLQAPRPSAPPLTDADESPRRDAEPVVRPDAASALHGGPEPARADAAPVVPANTKSAPGADAAPPIHGATDAELPARHHTAPLAGDHRALPDSGEPSDDELRIALHICRRLEGVPLAIELAAAQVAEYSMVQLVRMLDAGQGWLGVPDAALRRHRSLRAAVGAGYALCEPTERTTWARLSVFAGDFDEDAAVFVCSGGGLGAEEVPVCLARLVLASVLTPVRDPGGVLPPRYRMTEAARGFGAERLQSAGETAAAVSRHLYWYANIASSAHHLWSTGLHERATALVREEEDNLHASLARQPHRADEAAAALAVAVDLWFWWAVCGRAAEGREHLRRLLPVGRADTRLCGQALWLAGWLAVCVDAPDAAELLGQAWRVGVLAGDDATIGRVSHVLGALALEEGRTERAIAHLREAADIIPVHAEHGPPAAVSWALLAVAQARVSPAAARRSIRRASAGPQPRHDLWTRSMTQYAQALVDHLRGRRSRAWRRAHKALAGANGVAGAAKAARTTATGEADGTTATGNGLPAVVTVAGPPGAALIHQLIADIEEGPSPSARHPDLHP